jgi:putative heme-binding domain-containing protein
LLARLDSESSFERCEAQQALERRGKEGVGEVVEAMKRSRLGVRGRLHAVWVLAKVEGPAAVEKLLTVAKTDPEPALRAQAVRAVADLADPVLVRHRLEAGAGDTTLARRIAALAVGADWRVQLEAVIALGRLRWAATPAWLRKNLKNPDATLAHAAQWALRRSGDWPAILKLLDDTSDPFRAICRRAVAGQYDSRLVGGLIERLKKESDAARRREYADLLVRVYKKPAPWTYWGFRPAPRPANTVPWERTEAIEQALGQMLADPDRALRLAVLRRMLREKVPAATAPLGRWLRQERQAETVAVLLAALGDRPGGEVRPALEAVVTDRKHTTTNRFLAVSLFLRGLEGERRLLEVAEAVEDGPVLAALLRGVGAQKARSASGLLLRKLTSKDVEVRASAVGALAEVGGREAHDPIRERLDDGSARVRAAAALAVGKLALRPAAGQLLKLARDADPGVRRASLEALRRLREPRALPVAVAALADLETALEALACVGELGGPEQAKAVADLAKRRPASDVLAAAGKILVGWASRRQDAEQALAEVHGSSGVLLGWHVLGPLSGDGDEEVKKINAGQSPTTGTDAPGWRRVLSVGTDARVRLGPARRADGAWLAFTDIAVDAAAKVEFFMAASAPATVWLNGKKVYRRDRPGVPGPYPERFEAALAKGSNALLVRLRGVKAAGEFRLRFRRKSATAEHERLTRAALSRAGNPEAGRKIFFDAEKSLCVKCHRIGDRGERIGPELTGLGSRFSKAYIVESVLEPSRTVSPSFETTLIELKNGKVVSGVQVAVTESAITLVDSQAQKHVLARSAIESQKKSPVSAMPEGLEKRLTEDEFVDLMSFLANLKTMRGR